MAFEGFFLSNVAVLYLAVSRVAAICTGVIVAMVLTCTVFPRTGSAKVRVISSEFAWAPRKAGC